MKYLFGLLILAFLQNHASAQQKTDVLFQTATINSLLNGVYDGDLSIGDLKKNGDFGIGTFNRLDGEMIAVDGNVYKVRVDGKAYAVSDSEKTPFACVTFFQGDTVINVTEELTLKELQNKIDALLPTPNIFYAIRIEGTISYVKTRSVPDQKRPYIPLVEIVKTQPTFEHKNTAGVVVGFRAPEFVSGVNVPGYHFHFLNKEKNAGGHVLDLSISNAKVSIDHTDGFYLSLPSTKDFYDSSLGQDKKHELEKVEK